MPQELSCLTAAGLQHRQKSTGSGLTENHTVGFIILCASVSLVHSNYNEMLACD